MFFLPLLNLCLLTWFLASPPRRSHSHTASFLILRSSFVPFPFLLLLQSHRCQIPFSSLLLSLSHSYFCAFSFCVDHGILLCTAWLQGSAPARHCPPCAGQSHAALRHWGKDVQRKPIAVTWLGVEQRSSRSVVLSLNALNRGGIFADFNSWTIKTIYRSAWCSPEIDLATCHDVSIQESNEQFSLFTVQPARLWLLVLSVVRITCDM